MCKNCKNNTEIILKKMNIYNQILIKGIYNTIILKEK